MTIDNESATRINNAQSDHQATQNELLQNIVDTIEENGVRRRRAVTKTAHVTVDNTELNVAVTGGSITATCDDLNASADGVTINGDNGGTATPVSVDENGYVDVNIKSGSITAASEPLNASIDGVTINGVNYGTVLPVNLDENGNVNVEIVGVDTAIHVSDLETQIYADATHGTLASNTRQYEYFGGTVTANTQGEMIATSGTTLNGYGALQTFRVISANANQKISVQFGVRFDIQDNNTDLFVGLLTIGDELSIGYQGLTFGFYYKRNGLSEIRTLGVTTAATSASDVTVTVDTIVGASTACVVSVTVDTVFVNAIEIAAGLKTCLAVYPIVVEQYDNQISIFYQDDDARDTSFTFSAGSTGMVAAFTRNATGTPSTITFTALEDFTHYTTLGFTLDPSKGNNFKIEYKGGYAGCSLYIQNPVYNGRYTLLHTELVQNEMDYQFVGNHRMRLGFYVFNRDVPSTSSSMAVSHLSAGVLRLNGVFTRNVRSVAYEQDGITNTECNQIIGLRNRQALGGRPNNYMVFPKRIVLSNNAARTAIFEIRGNPTITGTRNYQSVGNNLVVHVDRSTGVVTGGRLLVAGTIAGASDKLIDLQSLDINMPPSLTISVCGYFTKTVSQDNEIAAAVTWYEAV